MQNTAGDQVIAFNATRAQWIAAGYTTQISATTVPGRWGSKIANIVLGMQASGSDVTARPLRTADLQLTDTTFVAAGSNGNFVAFGEGNAGAGSRVITIREPAGASGPIGAAALSVADLSGNAADRIFGLTVDSLSQGVLANGTQAFFAALDTLSLFNLRLEGSYRTTLPGAGVAFHPQYVGPTSASTAASPSWLRATRRSRSWMPTTTSSGGCCPCGHASTGRSAPCDHNPTRRPPTPSCA